MLHLVSNVSSRSQHTGTVRVSKSVEEQFTLIFTKLPTISQGNRRINNISVRTVFSAKIQQAERRSMSSSRISRRQRTISSVDARRSTTRSLISATASTRYANNSRNSSLTSASPNPVIGEGSAPLKTSEPAHLGVSSSKAASGLLGHGYDNTHWRASSGYDNTTP